MKFFESLAARKTMPENDEVSICTLCSRVFCSADLVGGICPECLPESPEEATA